MREHQFLLLLVIFTVVSSLSSRHGDDDKIEKESSNASNARLRNFIFTNGSGKIIVQMKNTVNLVLNQNLRRTFEVNLEESILMGLEIKDAKFIDSLNEDSNVISVEPDYPVQMLKDHVLNVTSGESMKRYLKDSVPYGVDMVLQKRKKIQKMTAKGNVKICFPDTGYDIDHIDLPKSPDVIGKNGLGEKWDQDMNGHGTHLAGIVGALGNNGEGVSGLIPSNYDGHFKILITKGLDKSGTGVNSQIIDAVEDCVKLGAHVVSLSLGCNDCYSNAMDNYFKGLEKKNILVVAAAGNSGTSDYNYPASYESVISVASISSKKVRSKFSQHNDQIELSAPGISILSTVPGNKYATKEGTSMAAPYVAGAAALLRMFYPKCTSTQIRKALAYTAMDLGSNGCDTKTGFGLVQAYDAFKLLKDTKCGSLEGTPTGGCYSIQKKSKTNNDRSKSKNTKVRQ